MSGSLKFAMAVTVVSLATPLSALAGDQYSFPSVNGAQVAAVATPSFAPNIPIDPAQPNLVPGAPGSLSAPMNYRRDRHEPPPPAVGAGAYSGGANGGDAASYRFVTEAIGSSAYANYVADYARIFSPGYAVKSWTNRMFGIVEIGYGAVDGWTSATYGMERLRGSSRRSETPPDLSTMPVFRPHPELDRSPAFSKNP